MKWIVRCVVIICSVIGGVMSIPVVYVNSGDNVSSTIRYVALGDSIAYGYGLDDREQESYTAQICKYLEKYYDSVVHANFGQNGIRSDELLDVLTNPKNEKHNTYCATIRYADIVTLSIGSNDLLHLIELDFDMQENIRRDIPKFRKACKDFAVNFPKIIQVIRDLNPHAQIYANNIYNPAKGLDSLSGVYRVAEEYIDLLNKAFVFSQDYHLIDVKEAFDKQDESMINVAVKGRQIDPHPSKEGHTLIAQMVTKEMSINQMTKDG